jgi:predicted MPP superfamily phosphohydrolase
LVTDVHLGNVRGAAFVRHLVRRLLRARPEAVFISGDMFDGTKLDLARAVQPWSELTAARGIYFVSGNHDDMRDRVGNLAALEAVGIRVLNNESVLIGGLQIIGVHDAETDNAELFGDILRGMNLRPGQSSILLAHKPSNLAVAENAGISLQLSGHTHGGQFWPWSLIAARVYGKFVHGLNRFGRMLVYTSSGAGTWGPPFRVCTHSEIVLFRLVGA